MQVFFTDTDLALQVAKWKRDSLKIGLVPTMGHLHEGHISLIRLASEKTDKVIVSIYVNPLQFSQNEDFDNYPRAQDTDLEKLTQSGLCDAVYIPENMYPNGHATRIKPAGVAQGFESDHRPHFFEGVATIVLKLFNQTKADIAVFGEKDFQQLQVIKQMVVDLDVPITIISAPTIREADGLAMSSRNSYLNADERKIAANLHAQMACLAEAIKAGCNIEQQLEKARSQILKAGFSKMDYLCYCDLPSLRPCHEYHKDSILLAAAHIGHVRLIDCVKLSEAENAR